MRVPWSVVRWLPRPIRLWLIDRQLPVIKDVHGPSTNPWWNRRAEDGDA